ncbi:5-bromo-4-chloroindolyl phosphate hydrolysis family protein [Phaeobacter sp. C3_T13_0]|uniref:5-bromo-4-chloroindolyl phosphate hydrolysis family protein n=1 Tax=Phaeobacter cretensis TaxID=3342641 RepID=UPI0039BD7238
MAQRFGGKYSPDDRDPKAEQEPEARPAPNGYRSAKVDPVGVRANLMVLPAGLIALLSVFSSAAGLAFGLLAAATWAGSAYLLRDGLRAEAAYDERTVARRPVLPRKIVAAGLCGVGTLFAVWRQDPGALSALIYATAALGLHIAAFGLDPLSDKGTEGIDGFQRDRVARVVDEAENYLSAMKDAALRARDRKVEQRVDAFQEVARDLFRTVEEDPRDLTGARRYLTVYLMGARDATIKFADIYTRSGDAQSRVDYLALLQDLEENFAARTRKMLREDRTDLTVEIDVLRDRLQREGVHLDTR